MPAVSHFFKISSLLRIYFKVDVYKYIARELTGFKFTCME